jgi:hypothetical protein
VEGNTFAGLSPGGAEEKTIILPAHLVSELVFEPGISKMQTAPASKGFGKIRAADV